MAPSIGYLYSSYQSFFRYSSSLIRFFIGLSMCNTNTKSRSRPRNKPDKNQNNESIYSPDSEDASILKPFSLSNSMYSKLTTSKVSLNSDNTLSNSSWPQVYRSN